MRERAGIGSAWLIGSAGKHAATGAGREPEVSERRLRRAGRRAAAATLRRSRCGAGAGRDGGPGAGLAGERGRAGRGRRWGPERWPGEAAPLGSQAWALATLRKMLLVPCLWPRSEGGRACRFHLAAGRHAPASGSAGAWKVSDDTPQVAQPALDLCLESQRFC